jgi:hypothetical protein
LSHVQFSEGPGVKFPRSTQPMSLYRFSAPERRDFLKNSGILQLMGKVSFAHSQWA